jgi:hypothetical protein
MDLTQADTQHVAQHEAALMASIRQHLCAYLESEKRCIVAEIRSYPPPIPACDVQFNYLLDERTRIFQELGRVEALPQMNLAPNEYLAWVEEFILSSRFICGDAVDPIRSLLVELQPAAA